MGSKIACYRKQPLSVVPCRYETQKRNIAKTSCTPAKTSFLSRHLDKIHDMFSAASLSSEQANPEVSYRFAGTG
jgi:hypothetical protein